MPAHVSRQHRWRVAALVVLVIAGVGIAVGVRGTPAPVAAAPAPGSLVGAPDAESSAWYCTGQSVTGGVSPGFLVLTNTSSKSVTADITATSDSGATAHTAAGAKRRKRFTTMLRNLVCNGAGTTRHRASVILGGREVIVS